MKKSLIALAVISATGSAFAQSSVSIYGIMDAGYNQLSAETAGPTAKSTIKLSGGNASGAWASNRLGFKGTEDLGGGTTANFMYELGLNAGTNGDLATTNVRSSWISLANTGMGEVTIGRQYNPIFDTSASLDAGRANNVSFGRVVYGGNPVDTSITHIVTTRTSGGVKYTSPNFNGLVVKAIVGQNETENALTGVATATSASVMGGNISYTLGDLNLQAAIHKIDLKNPAAVSGTSTAATAGDRDENLFGGSYTMGNIKALAMYGATKVKNSAGAQFAKREGYQLGLQASLNGAYNTPGSVDLFATYGSADVQADSNSVEKTTKGTQFGGMYNLSKRTGVYAAYGKTTGTPIGAGSLFISSGNEFAAGVRHSF
jgi:hypothetical protein